MTGFTIDGRNVPASLGEVRPVHVPLRPDKADGEPLRGILTLRTTATWLPSVLLGRNAPLFV